MKKLEFPYCCTASILVDFGESDIAEGGAKNYSVEKIKNYIMGALNSPYVVNDAAVVIITNTEQSKVNEVLRSLKFEHSTWMAKEQHEETKIRIWWKQISVFMAEIEKE